MAIILKSNYRLNAISIKISIPLSIEREKTITATKCKYKGPQVAIALLSNKNRVIGVTILDRVRVQIQHYKIIVLAKNQTHRQVKQSRRSRNKAKQLQWPNFDKDTKINIRKMGAFRNTMVGKLNIHMQKSGTRSLSIILYKTQFKMHQRC